MSNMADQQTRRTASERRESILRAAADVFGRRGYVGATTDQVAKAAGISQPYVVRLFGSKEALFLAVLENAKGALLDAFRDGLAEARAAGADGDATLKILGDHYVELARDSGVHLSLLQAFVQGADPVIGAAARAGYIEIWRMLREEAGLDVTTAKDFLAEGMLLSVLLAVDMPALMGEDVCAAELLDAAAPRLPELLRSS
jgi:TetR/AcrR family transcriptional regulator